MSYHNHAPLTAFIEYLRFEKRYSPNTIRSYQDDLISFFDFLATDYGEMSLKDSKPAFIRSWLAQQKEQGASSKTLNRRISTLKSFFKFQLRQGEIEVSPMTTIVSPKISKRLPAFVDQKDTATFFEYAEFPDTWQGVTEQMIMTLLYSTGIRLSELINLKTSQVDLRLKQLKILGKGNKERLIPLSLEVEGLLKGYLEKKETNFTNRQHNEYLLINAKGKKLYPKYVQLVVKKYLSLITTISKKSPHVLRHTFATHLMNNGAELNAVKELLGHSSLAATQVYTHNTIEKLKDIHKKAHPKS
jgi:integrase/recombinase XerC